MPHEVLHRLEEKKKNTVLCMIMRVTKRSRGYLKGGILFPTTSLNA